MLTRKVIAYDIRNLTDARYFAAWYVDYLHFDLKNILLDQVLEIVDWVAGVPILLDISVDQWAIEQDKILSKIDAQQLVLPFAYANAHLKRFAYDLADQADVYILNDINHADIKDDSTYYLHRDWSLDEIKSAELSSAIGITITGGEEEQVGVKSYEDLDPIFEYLEE